MLVLNQLFFLTRYLILFCGSTQLKFNTFIRHGYSLIYWIRCYFGGVHINELKQFFYSLASRDLMYTNWFPIITPCMIKVGTCFSS